MIDLHTHTFMSDGSLSISELVYREKMIGYDTIAITDHTDFSNYQYVIDAVRKDKEWLIKGYGIDVLTGVEITYVPPIFIQEMVTKCRDYGAEIVVVHGETPSEKVPDGTNRRAIEAGVDVLAHPGYIRKEDVLLAKENNVCLEITSRRGHSKTNKWVADVAKKVGAKLVFCNDVHHPDNIITKQQILALLDEIGLNASDYDNMLDNAREIVKRNVL